MVVLPGLPSEMEAMFETVAGDLRGERPIESWRRTYRVRESDDVLAEAVDRWPEALVGSYPGFPPGGARVEVVVKSSRAGDLAEASAWIESALHGAPGGMSGRPRRAARCSATGG